MDWCIVLYRTGEVMRDESAVAARRVLQKYKTLQCESTLYDLLECEHPSLLDYCRPDVSIRSIINEFVFSHYPNEVIVKAAFANQVLMKSGDCTVSAFELPVGNSRIDLCKINGSSYAFEIKSDFDSFSRLAKQLDDYTKVFEYVYLIVSKDRLSSLPDFVSDGIGIYTYVHRRNGRFTFALHRTPQRNNELNPIMQLQAIPTCGLKKAFPQESEIYMGNQLIQAISEKYDSREVNRRFKRYFKNRYGDQWGFLKRQHERICEIDYGWFFHNNVAPEMVYQQSNQYLPN